jgi:uncharacterized OsmC-like protein
MADDEVKDVTDDDFYMAANIEASADSEYATINVRDKHDLFSDEPSWLPYGSGADAHPAPMDYMIVALTACQVSVLSQCLEKARVEDFSISAEGAIDSIRKEDVPEEMPGNTRTRVDHMSVEITVDVPEEYEHRAERCLEVYDQGCIVGQSYKAGIQYTPETNITLSD